jgi:hypothetical protein
MVTKGPDEMTSGMRSNGCQRLRAARPGALRGRHRPAIAAAGCRNGPPCQLHGGRTRTANAQMMGQVMPGRSGCRRNASRSSTPATRPAEGRRRYGTRLILLA